MTPAVRHNPGEGGLSPGMPLSPLGSAVARAMADEGLPVCPTLQEVLFVTAFFAKVFPG